MSRYRPQRAKSSAYITPEGFERLRSEQEELWTVRRPEVVAALSAAADEGDRSENAEYIYRKKQLREIDSRLGFLGRRLDQLIVVDAPPDDQERVFFGAYVTLEREDELLEEGAEESLEVRVVGPDESDHARRFISMDAPLGRALLGKRLDDEVTVHRPLGEQNFVILAIRY